MRAWIDDIFSEEKILKTLLIIGLLFFVMLISIIVKDSIDGCADFKELSNWVQAFIAIWTLLALIYTAKKAYLASEKSNIISTNSSAIAEISMNKDLIFSIFEKIEK
ncbi:hypothetical protein [Gluconobacter cerinus]|uniref:hypothetical protein n=1 Tax=Gluconobacter cerinus TaxID=38307 RepID=UPI001B8C425C|nr:hypothetical protein [Gluconobacter cerinus]MBS1035552.1 hypothetical protein [Gluconobacter cerinus]